MTKLYTVALLMFLMAAGVLRAQTSITSTDQTYSQNFNSLSSTGSTNALSIPNWVISSSVYIANDGAGTTGAIYSYGPSGNTDRALGGLISGNVNFQKIFFGTSFKNTTGESIGKIKVDYTGEQWKNGNKALLSTGAQLPDSLVFQYSLNATGVLDSTATWTEVPGLTFISPNLSPTEGKLDGNAAENKASLSSELNISLANNQTVYIRWAYIRSTAGIGGSRDGLAVDDLTVTFGEGGEVPVDECDFDEGAFVEITSLENDLESFTIEYTPIEGASGYLILLDLFNPDFEDYQDYLFPEDETTYEVGDVIEDEFGGVFVIGKTSLTSFEYTELEANEGYYVRVIPYYECEESVYYGDFSERYFSTAENTCDAAYLIAPASSNVSVSGNSATLTISPVEGAVGYIVFIDDADLVDDDYEWGFPEDGETYAAGESVGMSKVAYVGSNTTISINNLGDNKLYYISIHPIFECDEINTYGHYTENSIETSVATSVKREKLSNVLIYPNPVSGNVLNVRLDAATQGKANVQIFNVVGAQVYSAHQSISSNTQLTLPAQLPAGRYTLRIEQDGATQIGSFIVLR